MEVKFLGWENSFLELCVKEVFDNFATNSSLNLSNHILVSSSSRFNRNLKEQLLIRAKNQNIKLELNNLITLGNLPNLISPLPLNIATKDEERFAWVSSILDNQNKKSEKYLGSSLNFSKALNLADEFNSLKNELGRNFLNFSDILEESKHELSQSEIERISFFNDLYKSYLEVLRGKKLECKDFWFKESIKKDYFKKNKNIILFNCIDLTKRLVSILDCIKGDIKHLIFTSNDYKSGFNEYGVINTDYWLGEKLNIPLEEIIKVDSQNDQSEIVLKKIKNSDLTTSIIYRDNLSAKLISHKFKEADIGHTLALSDNLNNSLIGTLIKTIKDFYSIANNKTFSALIKNNYLFTYLTENKESQEEFIKMAESYQEKYFQDNYSNFLLNLPKELKSYYINFKELTSKFDENSNLKECVKVFNSFFKLLFSSKVTTKDQNFNLELNLKAYEAIFVIIDELEALSETYLENEMAFIDFLSLIITKLNSVDYYTELSSDKINIVGSLEALLDKTENIILADCNEGLLPESVSNSWLFSDTFRKNFGLANNESRFGREIYFCKALIASKKEVSYLIPKKDSIEGGELLPSKIFYLREAKLNTLVDFLFEENAKETKIKVVNNSDYAFFNLKKPELEEDVEKLSVTSFRSYIECPYRFYLKHIKKLYPIETDNLELKANHFGSIIHNLLDQFAKSTYKDSSDAKEINNFFNNSLKDYFIRNYGKNSLPALKLQEEVIKLRLKNFSLFQAKRRKEGWLISESEYNLENLNVCLEHKNGLTLLSGRVDRIDKNINDGRISIIDYKTSNTVYDPSLLHRKKGEWVDLQLPLYWHSLKDKYKNLDIELAYICISAERGIAQYKKFKVLEEDLIKAIDLAKEIAFKISTGVFWPPKEVNYEDSLSFALKESVLND